MPSPQIRDDVFIRRYFQLPPKEVGYLRFLVEGYDGLVFLRTVDGRRALVEISHPPSRQREAAKLISALQTEIGLAEVPAPEAEP